MRCPDCNNVVECVDMCIAGMKHKFLSHGKIIGTIYLCVRCEAHFLDNEVEDKVEVWDYALPLSL